MTNILVTGGAGFIGSHLVEELVKKGYNVKVIDNLSRNTNNVKHLIREKKIEFIKGDVRDWDVVFDSMKGIDYVFHKSAVCIKRCIQFPHEAIDVNLNGSYNVFRAALENKVKKVIFDSTSSVYGEPDKLPMAEDAAIKPVEPYGATKIAAEFMLEFLSKKGLDYFTFRYFNVYGPKQSTDAYYTSEVPECKIIK